MLKEETVLGSMVVVVEASVVEALNEVEGSTVEVTDAVDVEMDEHVNL